MKHTATDAEKKAVLDAVFAPLENEPPVRSSELVRLRRVSKRSLTHWTREMKRAAKDLRSGDERNARDAVVWLDGYLKALDDVEQSNVCMSEGADK